MVNYNPSKDKEYVRNRTYSFFSKCSSIVTLPNLYFDLELDCLKRGQSVTCVERDRAVYEKQKSIIPSNIRLLLGDINHLDVSKYDGLFLDYCGTFTFGAEELLNKVKRGGLVVITLLQRREGRALKRLINIKDRDKSYTQLFQRMGFEVVNIIKYETKSPMAVFFMKKL